MFFHPVTYHSEKMNATGKAARLSAAALFQREAGRVEVRIEMPAYHMIKAQKGESRDTALHKIIWDFG